MPEKSGLLFYLLTNIHLLSTYYVLCLHLHFFLPLLLLFLVMVSSYPAVHHPLATVMFVAKKGNKLMNKNLSPSHSITGPDLNLCFGSNNGDFVLCTFFLSQLWPCSIQMCHRKSFCNLPEYYVNLHELWSQISWVGVITLFHITCVSLAK